MAFPFETMKGFCATDFLLISICRLGALACLCTGRSGLATTTAPVDFHLLSADQESMLHGSLNHVAPTSADPYACEVRYKSSEQSTN